MTSTSMPAGAIVVSRILNDTPGHDQEPEDAAMICDLYRAIPPWQSKRMILSFVLSNEDGSPIRSSP